jgi:hypothetical protein
VAKHFPVLDEKQGRNLIPTVRPDQNRCGNKGHLVNQNEPVGREEISEQTETTVETEIRKHTSFATSSSGLPSLSFSSTYGLL